MFEAKVAKRRLALELMSCMERVEIVRAWTAFDQLYAQLNFIPLRSTGYGISTAQITAARAGSWYDDADILPARKAIW